MRSSEVLPDLSEEELIKAQRILERIELGYTVAFTVELALNFFARYDIECTRANERVHVHVCE